TADPAVYAIGDCAEHPNVFARPDVDVSAGKPANASARSGPLAGTGTRTRLESVQNACDQGRAVAAASAGRRLPYRALPWLWTDQFNVRLQMAGLSHGHDRLVVRGDRGLGKFSLFYFAQDRLVAVDSVNRPVDHMIARKLLSAGTPITPEQAADET